MIYNEVEAHVLLNKKETDLLRRAMKLLDAIRETYNDKNYGDDQDGIDAASAAASIEDLLDRCKQADARVKLDRVMGL